MSILSGVAHAKIKGEPGKKNTRETSIAQIAYETGRRLAVILVEGRVGVDLAMDTFAQHEPGVGNVQVLMEFGAARGLNAMVWPKNLWPILGDDGVVGLLAGMRRRDRKMVS